MYVDAHCHLYAFEDGEIIKIFDELDISMLAVSENIESSKRSIDLTSISEKIYPCVGLHPWEVKGEESLQEAEEIIGMHKRAKCFGEIGLDKRFNTENYEYQKEIFYKFVEASSKLKMPLNIHALDAWKEVFEIISSYGIKKAIFHWYSGPIDLLKKIEEHGYFITINPSASFQKKHGAVLRHSPTSILLTESDGPYNYKGRVLHPRMVPETVQLIADLKKIDRNELLNIIQSNFRKYLKW